MLPARARVAARAAGWLDRRLDSRRLRGLPLRRYLNWLAMSEALRSIDEKIVVFEAPEGGDLALKRCD